MIFFPTKLLTKIFIIAMICYMATVSR